MIGHPETFLHGKEWLTWVKVDKNTKFTREATKAEIEAAKAWKPEADKIVIDGKTLPWARPDKHTAVAGDPLPPSHETDKAA